MKVIYLKAFVATFLPAGAAFSVAWAVYEKSDSWPSGPKVVAIVVGVLMAGASGLGSFLSTSYADHKEEAAEVESRNMLTAVGHGPTVGT
jgi:hypothetical protein